MKPLSIARTKILEAQAILSAIDDYLVDIESDTATVKGIAEQLTIVGKLFDASLAKVGEAAGSIVKEAPNIVKEATRREYY